MQVIAKVIGLGFPVRDVDEKLLKGLRISPVKRRIGRRTDGQISIGRHAEQKIKDQFRKYRRPLSAGNGDKGNIREGGKIKSGCRMNTRRKTIKKCAAQEKTEVLAIK